MYLDLMSMLTILIIMSLIFIGILLYLIIVWSDSFTTKEEQYYEDLEQINYLKNYKRNKSK